MASKTGTADRFVDAIGETSAAVNDRIKAGIERAQRISTAVVTETERAQQDVLEFGRKLLEDPADVVGISTLAFAKMGAAQDRAFDFARNLLDEAATASRETRTAVERIAQANFDAGRPGFESMRDLVTKTSEALRPSFMRANEAEPAPAPRARKATADEAA
jgi:hypothetical protein